MQISGHKNIHSINNYSHINEDQHGQISEILYTDAPSSNALYGQDMQPRVQSQQSYLHSSKTMKTASNSSVHVSGGFQSIFGAQIHGGTFNIHIHQKYETMETFLQLGKGCEFLKVTVTQIELFHLFKCFQS